MPIISYGHPLLKKKAQEITPEYPGLEKLIAQMFTTMYEANGVGLAAPQIGKSIRLFVVDASPYGQEHPEAANFKQVFINPVIIREYGQLWSFNEGCLSIPGINEDVERFSTIDIEYYDEHFQLQRFTYDGIIARIIQHEYDHLEGILFVDRLPPLRKMLLKGRLQKIMRGEVDVKYRMIFPDRKKAK